MGGTVYRIMTFTEYWRVDLSKCVGVTLPEPPAPIPPKTPTVYLRDRRIAQGLCPSCGKPKDKVGYLCRKHRKYNRDYQQRTRDRAKGV